MPVSGGRAEGYNMRWDLAASAYELKLEGNEKLRPLGGKFLWEGAQEIVFRET